MEMTLQSPSAYTQTLEPPIRSNPSIPDGRGKSSLADAFRDDGGGGDHGLSGDQIVPSSSEGKDGGGKGGHSTACKRPGQPGDGAQDSPTPGSQRRLPGGRRGPGGEREEAEGGGGRRAERLFVVRFDPMGEPETLTFQA
jgi:hypothetical protein